jgi:hypothetical protein
MKRVFPFIVLALLASCVKPKITPEERQQFEDCKKLLLENKDNFIASGTTPEQKDSLATYVKDFQENNLDQLIEKYGVEQEDIIPFIYSVCEKAEKSAETRDEENALMKTDSMIKVLDTIIAKDSLRHLKK